MPEQQLFEYAVVRYVPKVEREEFLNIGLILYCGKKHFLASRFDDNSCKLATLPSEFDMTELREYIASIQRVCIGGQDAGPLGSLTIAERFRWLTATRSTVIQTSKIHPGFCNNPQEELERLFILLVQ